MTRPPLVNLRPRRGDRGRQLSMDGLIPGRPSQTRWGQRAVYPVHHGGPGAVQVRNQSTRCAAHPSARRTERMGVVAKALMGENRGGADILEVDLLLAVEPGHELADSVDAARYPRTRSDRGSWIDPYVFPTPATRSLEPTRDPVTSEPVDSNKQPTASFKVERDSWPAEVARPSPNKRRHHHPVRPDTQGLP